MNQRAYRRILLKLSGESLLGEQGEALSHSAVTHIAAEISAVAALPLQVAIVLGGGNILRGAFQQELGVDRVSGDRAGMLATVVNSLILSEGLNRKGTVARVMTAFAIPGIVPQFTRESAIAALEGGEVVILAGGTGHPFFTTDTAAALRAAEIGADALLKATKVDGIYDADPEKEGEARLYRSLTYREVLKQDLKVMDAAAVALCESNGIAIRVFNFTVDGNIRKAAMGSNIGTTVMA